MRKDQTTKDQLAKLQKQFDNLMAEKAKPCPSCGRCPECGRGGYAYPYPYPYIAPYRPYITWGGTNATSGYSVVGTTTNDMPTTFTMSGNMASGNILHPLTDATA